jgi:tetratricopeptide (TPR) repeat protein
MTTQPLQNRDRSHLRKPGGPQSRGRGATRLSPAAGLPWSLAGILLATVIVYLPSLRNALTNWDDNQYLLNNPLVNQLSFQTLASLFKPTTYVLGNYHPLTLLTYALEWHFAGANPFVYHVTSLLLHLASTLLVCRVVLALTAGNARSALVTAALFALHPMHVESVAWISERKDVLYTVFFLGSLLMYLRHGASGRVRDLAGSLLLFLLSLLSKGQAVVLPAVMLLADAYQRRPLTRRSLLAKSPFFLLALVFGVIAVLAQWTGGNINNQNLPLWQSLFFASWGLVLYLVRFVVPAPLSAFHPYPLGPDGTLPLWVWSGPLVALAIAIAIFRTRSRRRDLYFGVLFFVLTIAPVLQLLSVGRAFVAERYTYVPYIGLCWIVGQAWPGAAAAGGRTRTRALRALVVAVIAGFALISGFRTRVWKDSVTLWTDVLAKSPACTLALVNRAQALIDAGQFSRAAGDCEKVVALNPRDARAYDQYGGALDYCGRYREAVTVLDRGVALDSTNHSLYVSRGVAYAGLGQDGPALRDVTRALSIDPTDTNARLQRGRLYLDRLRRYDLAAADYAEVLGRDPGNATAGCNLGLALARGGRLTDALRQLDRVAETSPRMAKVYEIRATVRAALGDSVRARSDQARAQALAGAGD